MHRRRLRGCMNASGDLRQWRSYQEWWAQAPQMKCGRKMGAYLSAVCCLSLLSAKNDLGTDYAAQGHNYSSDPIDRTFPSNLTWRPRSVRIVFRP